MKPDAIAKRLEISRKKKSDFNDAYLRKFCQKEKFGCDPLLRINPRPGTGSRITDTGRGRGAESAPLPTQLL